MFFLFLYFLRTNDFLVIRMGKGENKNILEENEIDLNQISDLLSINQNGKKWIIFADYSTVLSMNYMGVLLDNFAPSKTVIGRIGCIPFSSISSKRKTKLCKPYPIVKSGFVVSSDLLENLKDINKYTTEIEIGELLQDATFFDDFHFHYFNAKHSTRGRDFAASFWQNDKLNISNELVHAAGIPIEIMLTPKAEGIIKIGFSPEFQNKIVPTDPHFHISYECKPNITTVEHIPHFYLTNLSIGINCFNS